MIGLAALCWLAVTAELGPAAPGEPLTLAVAVATAQRESPAARRAHATYQDALAAAALTRPRLRPDLTLVAGATARVPQVRDPAPPNAIVERDLAARLELSARQILWHPGRHALDRRAAAATAAAEADLLAALSAIRQEVTTAWYDLLAARAGFAVADEAVKRAESQLARVKDLISLQKIADVDALHAEAGVLEARTARLEAANGVDLAQANLHRLLGQADYEAPLTPAADAALPAELPPLAEAVSHAQAHRPEVIALRARASEALAGGEFARAERLPVLALTGHLAAQTPAAFEPDAEALLGVELRWPLSRTDDAPARQAQSATAGRRQAELAMEELRLGIALEVRRAYRDEEVARQRYALAEARSVATTEAHRIKLLQYERQRATLLEVQQALLEQSRAELERTSALYDIHRARAALQRATAWSTPDVSREKEKDHAPD